jgi:hypothetical protein
MRLDKLKLVGKNADMIPAGNDGPHNGESDVCLIEGKLIAFNRNGLGHCDSDAWDWVHKDFRK